MPAREILREDWAPYLDSFSRVHQGWLTTLEVVHADTYAIEAIDKPLIGITAERTDHDEYAIAILLGGRADDRLTHIVREPYRMEVELTPDGADAGLNIEVADGTRIRLRFRAAARAESLDGVVLAGP